MASRSLPGIELLFERLWGQISEMKHKFCDRMSGEEQTVAARTMRLRSGHSLSPTGLHRTQAAVSLHDALIFHM